MKARQRRSPAVSRTTGHGREHASLKSSARRYFTTRGGNCKKTPVHDHEGRVVGVVEEGVFRKTVNADKHMLRVPPAWSFDVVSLEEAVTAGGEVIELHEERDDVVYRASMRQVDRYGKPLDRGHGEQRFLHLRYWAVAGEPVGEQLTLFGEGSHDKN